MREKNYSFLLYRLTLCNKYLSITQRDVVSFSLSIASRCWYKITWNLEKINGDKFGFFCTLNFNNYYLLCTERRNVAFAHFVHGRVINITFLCKQTLCNSLCHIDMWHDLGKIYKKILRKHLHVISVLRYLYCLSAYNISTTSTT